MMGIAIMNKTFMSYMSCCLSPRNLEVHSLKYYNTGSKFSKFYTLSCPYRD